MAKPEHFDTPTHGTLIPEFLRDIKPFASFSFLDGECLLFTFVNNTISVFVPNDTLNTISQLKKTIPEENRFFFRNRLHGECPIVNLELGAVAEVASFVSPSDPVGKPKVALEGVVATLDRPLITIELDARSVASLFRSPLPGELHDYNFMELRGKDNRLVLAFDTNKGIFILENSQAYPAVSQLSEFLSRLTNAIKTSAQTPFATDALLQAQVAVEQGWIDVTVPKGVQHTAALSEVYKQMYLMEVYFVALAAETKQDDRSKELSRKKLAELLPFATEAQRLLDAYAQRARVLQPNATLVGKVASWLELRRASTANAKRHVVGPEVWLKALPNQTKGILQQLEKEDVEKSPPKLPTSEPIHRQEQTQRRAIAKPDQLPPFIANTPERDVGNLIILEFKRVPHALDQDVLMLDHSSLLVLLGQFEQVAKIAQYFIPRISSESINNDVQRQRKYEWFMGIQQPSDVLSDPIPSREIWETTDAPVFGLHPKSVFQFEHHTKGKVTYQLIIRDTLRQIEDLVAFGTQFSTEPLTENLGTFVYGGSRNKDTQFVSLAKRLPESLRNMLKSNMLPNYVAQQSLNEVQIVQAAIQLHIARLTMTFISWGNFSQTMLGIDLKTWLEAISDTYMKLEKILESETLSYQHGTTEEKEPSTQAEIITNIAALRSEIPQSKRVFDMGQRQSTFLPVLDRLRAHVKHIRIGNSENARSSIELDSETALAISTSVPPELEQQYLLGNGYFHTIADELEVITNRIIVLQTIAAKVRERQNSEFRSGEIVTLKKIKSHLPLTNDEQELVHWLSLVLSDSHLDILSIPRFASALLQTIGLQLTTRWAKLLVTRDKVTADEVAIFTLRSSKFADAALALITT